MKINRLSDDPTNPLYGRFQAEPDEGVVIRGYITPMLWDHDPDPTAPLASAIHMRKDLIRAKVDPEWLRPRDAREEGLFLKLSQMAQGFWSKDAFADLDQGGDGAGAFLDGNTDPDRVPWADVYVSLDEIAEDDLPWYEDPDDAFDRIWGGEDAENSGDGLRADNWEDDEDFYTIPHVQIQNEPLEFQTNDWEPVDEDTHDAHTNGVNGHSIQFGLGQIGSRRLQESLLGDIRWHTSRDRHSWKRYKRRQWWRRPRRTVQVAKAA